MVELGAVASPIKELRSRPASAEAERCRTADGAVRGLGTANPRPPNTRVQRTRSSPSAHRSPLTRYPLGAETLLVALVSLVASAAASLAAPSGGPALAGCYEFEQGAWVPAVDLGGNAKYIVIPKTAELTLRPDNRSDKPSFVAQAISPIPAGGQRTGFWRVEGGDQVFVNWTDGLAGVSMTLHVKSDRLKGVAQTHWDAQGSLQNSAISARRIPCPVATPRRSK